MVFPSCDESAEVVHPGEEPLDLPSSLIAAQFASILGGAFATASVRGDQFDAIFGGELFIERVRVVGFVAYEPGREFVKKASGKNLFHKPALGRRGALDRYGERKTVTSGDSEDLGALAATGWTDRKAPFLAFAKVASTNTSSRFNLPCRYSSRASSLSASSSLPERIHCWKRRWQVWYGGYFSGNSRHCASVPSTQNTPLSTESVSCHGRPRLSARRASRSTGSTTAYCSSVNSQCPAIGACGATQSIFRMPHFQTFRCL